MKTVFQLDDDGWFTGLAVADESPLEPGVFLIPRGAVEQEPPAPPGDGRAPRWIAGRWVLQTPPAPKQPEPEPALELRRTVEPLAFLERFTQEERIRIRRAARQNEVLEDWLDMLRAAKDVDLDETRTRMGLAAMVNAALLTPQRRDEILS